MTDIHVGKLKGDHLAKGIPPTHKKLKISAITIDYVAGGKFVEEWKRYDTLSGMQKLCLLPTLKK